MLAGGTDTLAIPVPKPSEAARYKQRKKERTWKRKDEMIGRIQEVTDC